MNQTQAAENQLITEFDIYLFGQGEHHHIYEKLGAHVCEKDGVKGVYFAVWAPNARIVHVIGDFNCWNRHQHTMTPNKIGIWELFIPGVKYGDKYKFSITQHNDRYVYKTDPFGYYQEIRPSTASVVTDLSYTWKDQKWLEKRNNESPFDKPISVYEVHLGSWLHTSYDDPIKQDNFSPVPVPSKEGARFLTYRELADKLIAYVKEMGYTHIELLPVTEHPFDGSWGYQVVGYFAPTSRYGIPQDFMYFVEQCHLNDIGVIIDWVPGHFPKDEHGLAFFDGTCLFEHQDPRRGEHKGWGTLVFNYSRNEVRNFLISSAIFWFEKYHIDGIRVDAVSSMLYLNYERDPGQWIPNQHGGPENLEAVHFLQELNRTLFKYYPNILSIAEEATSWGNVSRPPEIGGLGFNFKWNMGWMNDVLKYIHVTPHDRSNYHGLITFSMWYAYNENFMLALSHDEVVHGKGHLFQKIHGDDWQKLANLRLLFSYMFTHPGKKTLFMGMELGQTEEWRFNLDLHWELLEYDPFKKLQQLVKDLNRIYRSQPALHTDDFTPNGFEWIDCDDVARSVVSFIRKDKYSDDFLIVICNFKPYNYHNYWLGVYQEGTYEVVLNTDSYEYWGRNVESRTEITTRHWDNSRFPFALEINVPAFSCLIFKLKK
jgi:1,4-alpha-glucan branching enzyme